MSVEQLSSRSDESCERDDTGVEEGVEVGVPWNLELGKFEFQSCSHETRGGQLDLRCLV